MKDTLDTYADVKGISKALGVSRATLYGLVRRGILPQGVKLGRSRRWRIADIQAVLARCELGVAHE